MGKCLEIRYFLSKFHSEGEIWHCHNPGNHLGVTNLTFKANLGSKNKKMCKVLSVCPWASLSPEKMSRVCWVFCQKIWFVKLYPYSIGLTLWSWSSVAVLRKLLIKKNILITFLKCCHQHKQTRKVQTFSKQS